MMTLMFVIALATLVSARPGPFYPNVPMPVYNQYTGPYPHQYVVMRHVRSPDSSGSSSYSSSSSSSSGGGGGTTSGTFMAPGPGGFGTMNAYAGNSIPNFGVPNFGYGGPPPNFYNQFDFFNFLQQYFNQLQANAQAQQAQAQDIANRGGFGGSAGPGGFGGSAGPGGFGGSAGPGDFVGGAATAQYSPQGGYGAASVFPPAEGGIDNRFGAETPSGPVNSVSGSFPASPGTNGVFTSSSSGFSDVNGKKTSYKTATVGVNKDGKVTTYTAHSP